jgi:uncharacterized repeat protein (TIGR02543 family)
VGDAFTSAGLMVRAFYSDGNAGNVTGYTLRWNGAALMEGSTAITAGTGTKIITVTYEGQTTSFAITVNEADEGLIITSIFVASQPAKTSYAENEAFSSAGLVISATYNDGSSGNVTGYTLSWNGLALAEGSTAITAGTGTKIIIVAYEGQAAGFGITIRGADATVTAIAVASPPTKISYAPGEAFSSAGLVVSATYSDGSSGNVTGYTLSWSGGSLAEGSEVITAGTGTKTVAVTYEGRTATFDITVNGAGATITAIIIGRPPAKISYSTGEAFSSAELVINAAYGNGSLGYVEGYTLSWNGAPLTEGSTAITAGTGTKTVTVTYEGRTVTFDITVNGAGATVTSITITSSPTKISYAAGEGFSSAGLMVSAAYSDGSSENVTGYTLSWNDAALAEGSTAITAGTGTKTVTVTYEGRTATFTISVAAQQPSGPYTVTFHPLGGSPAPGPQSVTAGEKATAPGSMTKPLEGLYEGTIDVDNPNVTFQGWYTNDNYTALYNFDSPVTGNLNLYAKWSASSVDLSGQTGANVIEKALDYLAGQTLSVATNYTIMLTGGAYTLFGISKNGQANIRTANVVITLAGKNLSEISLPSEGSLFRITAGELVLGRDITLKGRAENNMPLVEVTGSSASLTMKAGAKITGHSVRDGGLGAVSVGSGGAFTMSGGEITDNPDVGVYIDSGNFTMSGGEISDNSGIGVSVDSDGAFTMSGGEITGNSDYGVYVDSGSFTMSGGEISENSTDHRRGGVYIYNGGSFEMSGGEISDNSYVGVHVDSDGSFEMNGGKIFHNYRYSNDGGDGVFVGNGGTFTMSSGEISGNSSGYGVSVNGSFVMKTGAKITYNYGGVHIGTGSFEMSGGEVSHNSSPSRSEVSVDSNGSFEMSDGKISGNSSRSVSVNGSFEMSGGEISGNSATDYLNGVYVGRDGSFEMSGGEISNHSAFDGSGVYVDGSFIMKTGAKIIGNRAANGGGGVYVNNGGSFEMSGGEISGNSATSSSSGVGGGVYVSGIDSSFTMSGGKIFGNTATNSGGGVYATGGTFEMSGNAVISGNTAGSGGGVFLGGGTFTISGNAKISDNEAGGSGGGVYFYGTFTMSGGEISGNTASGSGTYSGGGGVYASAGGSFEMTGGEIYGNTASGSGDYFGGGGVYVFGINSHTFTMSGSAVISGNTASAFGGGVYVYSYNSSDSFSKTGGVIYGDTDGTHTSGSTENTATSGNTYGHAVYYCDYHTGTYSDYSYGYYCDDTLSSAASGNISTGDTLPANSGDSLNNWTKK